jgi:hypothetical protein
MELRLRPSFGGFFSGFILIAFFTFIYYFFFKLQISEAILYATFVAIFSIVIGIKPKHKERVERISEKIRFTFQGIVLLLISIALTVVIFDLFDDKQDVIIPYITNLDNRILVSILVVIIITLCSSAIKNLKKL